MNRLRFVPTKICKIFKLTSNQVQDDSMHCIYYHIILHGIKAAIIIKVIKNAFTGNTCFLLPSLSFSCRRGSINLAALFPVVFCSAKSRVEPKSTPEIPIIIMSFFLNVCPDHSAAPTPTISPSCGQTDLRVCTGISSYEQRQHVQSGKVIRWRYTFYLSFKEYLLTMNIEVFNLFK